MTLLLLVVSLDALVVHSPLSSGEGAAALGDLALAFVAAVAGSLGLAALALGLRAAGRQLLLARRLARLRRHMRRVSLDGVEALVFTSPTPQAFCAGVVRPTIYVSSGLLEHLGEREVRAVIAHERHHRANRDPARAWLMGAASGSLFFVPGVAALSWRYRQLSELAADEAAERRAGRRPLASALEAFSARAGAAVEEPRAARLALSGVAVAPSRTAVLAAVAGTTALLAACAWIAWITGCLDFDLALAMRDLPAALLSIAPSVVGAAILVARRRYDVS